MPKYVDGFVIPVPKKKVLEYQKIAKKAARVWKKHGALDYYECVGDDLRVRGITSFNKLARTKPSETLIFAWIVYRSKAHRKSVNRKVMKDPWILSYDPSQHPFDPRRMAFGGFKVIAQA